MNSYDRRFLAIAALIVAVLLLLILTDRAHGQAPAPAIATSQKVNVPGDAKSACGCALGGAPGACWPEASVLLIRERVREELPSCKRQLAARETEAAALEEALAACKALAGVKGAQASLLDAARLERQSAVDLAKKAGEGPAAAADLPWWRRFGPGVVLGVVVGAAATVGIVYAVTRGNGAGTTASGLRFSPLVRW